MDKNYRGLIWTNHALERLRQRGISQGDAWATWNRPDQSRKGSNDKETWVYYRIWGGTKVEVVAKQNEKKEWIILSVWADKLKENKSKSMALESGSLLSKIVKIIFKQK